MNTGPMSIPGPATTSHTLGPVDQIPLGEGRAFAVAGEQVAVFRLRDGTVRADGCERPHRGGPIADGTIDGQQVICPLHQHAFDLATGCSTTGAAPLRAYRASVDGERNLVVESGRV